MHFKEKITEFQKNSDSFLDSVILNESYKSTQIVFTKKEIQDISGVSINVVSKIINQLVDLGVIVPDSTVVKKGYRYRKIYEVFIGTKDYL